VLLVIRQLRSLNTAGYGRALTVWGYLFPIPNHYSPSEVASFDETLERVAQRGGSCPIPGNIPGQVGQGSEQPDLVEDVPAHCKGVGLDDF